MTRYVTFTNPGIIDPRSFQVMGVNAKENDSPIGFFGTGLKYAIAVVLRSGLKFTILAGHSRYTFHTSRDQFRNKQFDFVYFMRGDDTHPHPLPFTLELGKNWDVDAAFRELYSNMLDEQGSMSVEDFAPRSLGGYTQIIVSGPAEQIDEFVEAKYRMFLQTEPLFKCNFMEVHPKSSNNLYYKGIKVNKINDPCLVTYNITQDMMLTEDRTIASQWDVNRLVRDVWSEQIEDVDLIYDALTSKDTYESKLQLFANAYERLCTDAFNEAVKRYFKERPQAFTVDEVKKYYTWFGRPERKRINVPATLDAKLRKAHRVVTTIPTLGSADFDRIQVVPDAELDKGTLALYDGTERTILLTESALKADFNDLVATLIEEYTHMLHGLVDYSPPMQNFLFATCADLAITLSNRRRGAK